jgi:UrcA family protein
MKTLFYSTLFALLSVAATAVAPRAASAQKEESVLVTSPYVSNVVRVGRRAGETTMSLQRRVPYRDLDLRRPSDVEELWRRIDSAATEICEDLAQRYPLGTEPGHGCVPEAVGGSTDQVNGAISHASFAP